MQEDEYVVMDEKGRIVSRGNSFSQAKQKAGRNGYFMKAKRIKKRLSNSASKAGKKVKKTASRAREKASGSDVKSKVVNAAEGFADAGEKFNDAFSKSFQSPDKRSNSMGFGLEQDSGFLGMEEDSQPGIGMDVRVEGFGGSESSSLGSGLDLEMDTMSPDSENLELESDIDLDVR